MIVVANAGPLIALAQIGQLDVLRLLDGQLWIPRAVWDEVVLSGRQRQGALEVESGPWICRVDVKDATAVRFLRERLGAGESEAIVLAIESNAEILIIDEARGRRIAESHGLNKIGTLGTLVLAKQRELLPAVTPLLDALVASGFHMSAELYQKVRALANENK